MLILIKNGNKVYLLEFFVDDSKYFIYRYRKIFKVFDSSLTILFQTLSRIELSKYLGEIWNFEIFLPNRNTDILEIAPLAYTYVMNFIDQDHYEGTNFNSFKNLGQYKNFKLDVIYAQLGIYNKKYFNYIKNKQNLVEEINKSKSLYDKANEMQIKISSLLENIVVPENIEELNIELTIRSEEYNVILKSMNKLRYELTNLRNERNELMIALNQINRFKHNKEQEIKIILNDNICPECYSKLNDTIGLRSKRYNLIEDSQYISDSIFEDIEKIKESISEKESSYKELSIKLELYTEKFSVTKKEIKNYASYMGLNELYNSLNIERVNELNIQNNINDKIVNIKKELDRISENKQDINKEYYNMIDAEVLKFGLNELDDSQYKSINRVFCASGSNKPISTVIWYFVLNVLKKYFNKSSLQLPMVLDSPKNAEMDIDKDQALTNYILENSDNYSQLIFSSIGLEKFELVHNDKINVIELKNEKYHLLNAKVFKENEELLDNILNAQLI
ncbi:hypothetical protein [Otariodibacter oris]|uniref:hypothetical protein n=1 Tax=Otariodibacter oris TaxID=1032623 RepID=UPI001B8640EF|nr:hypothetical protein [Otariodibacter oris]